MDEVRPINPPRTSVAYFKKGRNLLLVARYSSQRHSFLVPLFFLTIFYLFAR